MRFYMLCYAVVYIVKDIIELYMLDIIVVEKVKQKCILNKRAECQKLNFEGLIVIILRLFSLKNFYRFLYIYPRRKLVL